MKWLEHTKQGWLNLYYAKLRSLLALLGVLVGTASVVAMVSGGELATQEALKQFKSLGTDLFAVSINSASDEAHANMGRSDNLSVTQALNLAEADHSILQIAPYTQLFHPIFYAGKPLSGIILGVTDHFADMNHIQLKAGRFVSLLDKYEFYCVIGHDIYTAMKQISFQEPLGSQLHIGNAIFVIVGVADAWPENNFVYANVDTAIMVPIMASMAISEYATINNIMMRLSADANIPLVKTHVTEVINHLLTTKQVTTRSAKELMAKMEKQSDILTVFLGLIGSISLIVGGIGVMNIMLVSVMERRREIGIRLAVGAKRKDIGALFLMEAIMLSLTGGFAGVVVGLVITYLMALIWHWQFTLFWWPPLAGFSVSVAVGIFFGFYPAYLASKLNPIEALRGE